MKILKKSCLALLIVLSLQKTMHSITKQEALDLLKLQDDYSEENLNRSYKKLALESHPDKAGLTPEQKEAATKRFQALGEAKEKLQLTKPAKELIKSRTDAWKNDNGMEKKGFKYWITKWLKQDENRSSFQQNQEAIWDFIEDRDIEEIKKAIFESNTYDTETLKEEIIKLATEINVENNPQAQQEEQLRREAEEKQRQEANRIRQEQERIQQEINELRRKEFERTETEERRDQEELENKEREGLRQELERISSEIAEKHRKEQEQRNAAEKESKQSVLHPKIKELTTQALELTTHLF